MAEARADAGAGAGAGHGDYDAWGRPGRLDEEQQGAMRMFLERAVEEHVQEVRFGPAESRESCACRFLRARGFVAEDALQLLEEAVRMRQEHGVQQLREGTREDCLGCAPEVLQALDPHAVFGFDRYNRPVAYERLGAADIPVLPIVTSPEQILQNHWWTMERQVEEALMQARATGAGPAAEGVDSGGADASLSSILDMEGLSTKHTSRMFLDLVKSLSVVDNTCYPETLGRLFIINAPMLFSKIWDIVKRWLDPRTQAKIAILAGPEEWRPRLEQLISPENLPEEYGGLAGRCYEDTPGVQRVVIQKKYPTVQSCFVPPNHELTFDGYIGEVEMQFEVRSWPVCLEEERGERGAAVTGAAARLAPATYMFSPPVAEASSPMAAPPGSPGSNPLPGSPLSTLPTRPIGDPMVHIPLSVIRPTPPSVRHRFQFGFETDDTPREFLFSYRNTRMGNKTVVTRLVVTPKTAPAPTAAEVTTEPSAERAGADADANADTKPFANENDDGDGLPATSTATTAAAVAVSEAKPETLISSDAYDTASKEPEETKPAEPENPPVGRE